MANSLNINLTNKYVIVNMFYFDQPYVFKCEGGFGCEPNTNGNAVGGIFIIDNENARIEGYQIERLATDQEIQDKKVSEQTLLQEIKKLKKNYTTLCTKTAELLDLIDKSKSVQATTSLKKAFDDFYEEKFAKNRPYYPIVF